MNITKNEKGIALVATLMFLMAMGILSTALIFTVQNEMKTSAAFKYGQQSFYVSNAGVQKAVDWYRNSYTPVLGSYDLSNPRPQYSGHDVVLAGLSGYTSNYPNTSMPSSFSDAFGASSTASELEADAKNKGKYALNATLLKYRDVTFMDIHDFAHPINSSVERWQIDSMGYWGSITKPLGISQITAVIQNDGDAFFDRALWGKIKVDLGGASLIDSFDPAKGAWNSSTNSGDFGAIGSNQLVTGSGNMTVDGDIAYGPSGSVTLGVNTTVTGDIIHLSENRQFEPIPPFSVGSGTVKYKDTTTLLPGQYGSVTADKSLTIGPGTYYFRDLTVKGTLIVAGTTDLFASNGLDVQGQAQAGDPAHPELLTVWYSGTGTIKWNGGTGVSASIYAPDATLVLNGGTEISGSFIANIVETSGNANIHFDQGSMNRHLLPRPFRIITWSQSTN